MKKIKPVRAKYCILGRGRFGMYSNPLPDGKHLILEAQDNWPFPKHHVLDKSEFKLLKGIERIDEPEPEYEEAPF